MGLWGDCEGPFTSVSMGAEKGEWVAGMAGEGRDAIQSQSRQLARNVARESYSPRIRPNR